MPNVTQILTAVFVAAGISAILPGIVGSLSSSSSARYRSATAVLSVGIGFAIGCIILGNWPRWPFKQDQDRLLGIVMPAVVIVETLARFPRISNRAISSLRLTLLALLVPILLFGSRYLTGLTGSARDDWSLTQALVHFVGWGVAIGSSWWLFARLTTRAPAPSHLISLAITSAGAGLLLMLSGYASGGLIGLPLSAALLGSCAFGTLLAGRGSDVIVAPVGVGMIGIASLTAIGHYFGELTLANAALVFLALLSGWLTELPRVRALPDGLRGFFRVALVGCLISVLIVFARNKFVEDYSQFIGSE